MSAPKGGPAGRDAAAGKDGGRPTAATGVTIVEPAPPSPTPAGKTYLVRFRTRPRWTWCDVRRRDEDLGRAAKRGRELLRRDRLSAASVPGHDRCGRVQPRRHSAPRPADMTAVSARAGGGVPRRTVPAPGSAATSWRPWRPPGLGHYWRSRGVPAALDNRPSTGPFDYTTAVVPAAAFRHAPRPAGHESCTPGSPPRPPAARVRPVFCPQRPAGLPSCHTPRSRTRLGPGAGVVPGGALGAGVGRMVVDHSVCEARQRLAGRRQQPARPPFIPAGILHRHFHPQPRGSAAAAAAVIPDLTVFYGRPRTAPAGRPCPPHGLTYQPRQGVDAPRAPPPRPQTAIAFFLPL